MNLFVVIATLVGIGTYLVVKYRNSTNNSDSPIDDSEGENQNLPHYPVVPLEERRNAQPIFTGSPEIRVQIREYRDQFLENVTESDSESDNDIEIQESKAPEISNPFGFEEDWEKPCHYSCSKS